MHLENWEKARSTLLKALNMGVDIVGSFRNDYKEGVKEFKEETGIELPQDLAYILGGNVEVSDSVETDTAGRFFESENKGE